MVLNPNQHGKRSNVTKSSYPDLQVTPLIVLPAQLQRRLRVDLVALQLYQIADHLQRVVRRHLAPVDLQPATPRERREELLAAVRPRPAQAHRRVLILLREEANLERRRLAREDEMLERLLRLVSISTGRSSATVDIIAGAPNKA